jgi:hypothetical protein
MSLAPQRNDSAPDLHIRTSRHVIIPRRSELWRSATLIAGPRVSLPLNRQLQTSCLVGLGRSPVRTFHARAISPGTQGTMNPPVFDSRPLVGNMCTFLVGTDGWCHAWMMPQARACAVRQRRCRIPRHWFAGRRPPGFDRSTPALSGRPRLPAPGVFATQRAGMPYPAPSQAVVRSQVLDQQTSPGPARERRVACMAPDHAHGWSGQPDS